MRQHQQRDRGASLVEFALVLPILSLFLFGIVQFGIAYDKKQSINSAAREAARIAALEDSTLEDVATRASNAYDTSAAPGEDVLVEVFDSTGTLHGVRDSSLTYSVAKDDASLMPCGESPADTYVTVVVSTPFDITIPFFGVREALIEAKAEFRCE